jgi:uncharacterized membrane protein YqiK
VGFGRPTVRLLATLLLGALPPVIAYILISRLEEPWISSVGNATAVLAALAVTIAWAVTVTILVQREFAGETRSMIQLAEQGVSIAELHANSHIKQATGEAEAVRLRAIGEAQAIRATGQAKAEAYRVGVEALGSQGYTVMQLMQIVGERNVRIVPDVAVTGAAGNTGLVDGLLGLMLRNQTNGETAKKNN